MSLENLDLKITQGTLQEVFNLQKALSDALRDKGVKFSLKGVTLGKVLKSEAGETDVGGIIDMALSVVTDEKVRSNLLVLCKKATVQVAGNTIKVDFDFFEKVENRQYYYPIMTEILMENFAPFFPGLNFKSLIPGFLESKDPE